MLCVAHGTSLRGIVKHIERLSEEEITKTDLPNSIPIVYRQVAFSAAKVTLQSPMSVCPLLEIPNSLKLFITTTLNTSLIVRKKNKLQPGGPFKSPCTD